MKEMNELERLFHELPKQTWSKGVGHTVMVDTGESPGPIRLCCVDSLQIGQKAAGNYEGNAAGNVAQFMVGAHESAQQIFHGVRTTRDLLVAISDLRAGYPESELHVDARELLSRADQIFARLGMGGLIDRDPSENLHKGFDDASVCAFDWNFRHSGSGEWVKGEDGNIFSREGATIARVCEMDGRVLYDDQTRDPQFVEKATEFIVAMRAAAPALIESVKAGEELLLVMDDMLAGYPVNELHTEPDALCKRAMDALRLLGEAPEKEAVSAPSP